jgi:tol-pal system protein YbgF
MNRKPMLWLPITFFALLPLSMADNTKVEVVRLQNDVSAMQEQIRGIEKSFKETTDGIKSLVVQLNDQVATSSRTLDKILKTLETQAAASQSSDKALLQEIKNLSGKFDDASTRISALAQQIEDLKIQAKPITEAQSISPDAIFEQAKRDYNQENYQLAAQGFTGYLNDYATGPHAAEARLYLGLAAYAQKNSQDALAAFTRVISDYPASPSAATALFKRASIELENSEKENAAADFRSIVQKYPDSPEASLAKERLAAMNASSRPARGSSPTKKR